MSDVPEILEGQVPAGTERITRRYVEQPEDEIPMIDEDNPRRATGIPVKQAEHQVLRIMVQFDPRPLMKIVNEAVKTNDINKVMESLRNIRMDVKELSPTLVQATLKPK